ncbi:GNAT family N-acetyltransferase [Aestuariivirga sp.]|uniref:GNAT family N-acetyltransferase n=1 Tax=Aestuariivirga sp. TaxID=2650926 RepID=UPI0039E539C3
MGARVRVVDRIAEIPATVWNGLTQAAGGERNPSISHAFLAAMEDSGCVGGKTGWVPQHVVLEEDGAITGVAPCYLKSHSMGEYVFDHGFADAFHRAGGRYYPKLQVSVPFSPVPGPRLLAATDDRKQLLAEGLKTLARDLGASSVHITFEPEQDWRLLRGAGFLQRQDIQFHWHNQGYGSFQDFLAALSSSKRKNIRKEREAVAARGITFEHATGAALTTAHWDHFYRFYMDTSSRKWGKPYLNRAFFARIHETMADDVLLVLAKRDDKVIAGALNLVGSDRLYGRNWGCVEDHPFLHFETCYYQAIDFAIARGLKIVEAGAQGEHKLARGYLPVKTYSSHHFVHAGLARAVDDYLASERAAVDENSEILSKHSPFRVERE